MSRVPAVDLSLPFAPFWTWRMTSLRYILAYTLLACMGVDAFQAPSLGALRRPAGACASYSRPCLSAKGDGEEEQARPDAPKTRRFDPIGELVEVFKNMDSVMDDFLMKRMGNGEVG